jgi:hypothetical protein
MVETVPASHGAEESQTIVLLSEASEHFILCQPLAMEISVSRPGPTIAPSPGNSHLVDPGAS